ncbi:hypothetical protein M422DRAFT_29922 [Sphaerobolus stellatus SS14]|uniref:Deoxycytidylate deaminase n=1 Tax=Sphaerobolus stellatus (strain SS14) TaxID=990650 RepID=A0A0C9W0T7_SPHS4|nr:hypothetical protein M422DRAFT_29922 [Sphaerobolus stellatus SS14]
MFISIVGTRASGKTSVEDLLISEHEYQPVRLGVKPESSPNGVSSRLPTLYFETPAALLEYVTQHWLESFVTCDLDTPELVELFNKRPFFLLVFIDAPLLTRYRRSHFNTSLESFVEEDDALHYGTPALSTSKPKHQYAPLQRLSRFANIHLINPFDTLSELHAYLREFNLTNPDRLRPQWDTYFMTLASLASHRSNCMKRRVGAILVRDKRIVATGYNGTPRNVRNCNEGGCKRCNSGGPSGEGLDECLCLHAEENALLEAGRERVGLGSVLYCNTCPCLGCAIKIVQTGVKEVVYNLTYKVDDRTEALFKEAGVIIRQHSPPEY